jgi:polyphosphate kinase
MTETTGTDQSLTEQVQAMLGAVIDWRLSGLSRRKFARSREMSAGTLGSWAHRLARLGITVEEDGTVTRDPDAPAVEAIADLPLPEPQQLEVPEQEPGTEAEPEVGPEDEPPTRELAPPPDDSDLDTPDYYLNRELTWLSFNRRVLHEADDPRNPLLDRVKFAAIVDATLDEFFMKRIGGLKQQVFAGVSKRTVDGRTPQEQIDECYDYVDGTRDEQRRVLQHLLELLDGEGIRLADYADLGDDDRAWLRDWYLANVFPLVTPQSMDPAHPFPFVSNLSLNLLVTLHHPGEQAELLARVKVPQGGGIKRLVRLGDRAVFVPLERVISHNLDLLFPGMEVESCELFRVTRNANTEVDEDEADDLLSMIESELRERKFAPIVRLEVEQGMRPRHRGMLAAELGLNEAADVWETDTLLALGDLFELLGVDRPDLLTPSHRPADHPALTTERPIFHTIRNDGPLLLRHPFVSFNTSVERLLREAASDPKVRAIKMTLYRTSAGTQVIDHLLEAARNGKQVAVVVELKARFDEAANIRWASRLEEVGIHVTYGVVGLKTHCKLIQIVRQDYDGLRSYAHIGTGNYHAGNARLYTDLGLLTADPLVGRDLTEAFNYLTTGYKPKRLYKKMLLAPKLMKPSLLRFIEDEIEHQRAGGRGHIRLKTNALEDKTVTRALYRASRAGVQVDLVVRDTCRLRPGVPGLSDNVRVVSIVGRFLEHSRVYYFLNGGDERFFLGSADLMKRNLTSRVETLAPVEQPELREDMREVLDLALNDQRNGWEMQPDGSYVQRTPSTPEEETSSQQALVEIADRRHKQATRLRKRQLKGVARRGGSPR